MPQLAIGLQYSTISSERIGNTRQTLISLRPEPRKPAHEPAHVFGIVRLFHDLQPFHTKLRVRVKTSRVPVFSITTNTIKINEQGTIILLKVQNVYFPEVAKNKALSVK